MNLTCGLGVDEGDEIARGRLPKLQQAHLHDEDSQHDENARVNVPEAHGVSLEGVDSHCVRAAA